MEAFSDGMHLAFGVFFAVAAARIIQSEDGPWFIAIPLAFLLLIFAGSNFAIVLG
ncbi:MAG: hypothetical protein LC687_07755 [Actinobacteria bacterium]|nr:hypothetical protein [Actinomycetota bacterium]